MILPKSCTNELILVLNGVEDYLQIVLGSNQDLLWHWMGKTFQQTITFLAPHLKYLFTTLRISPDQLKGVVVVSGPGSFTGLRLIFGHVYGLALSADLKTGSLTYHPLIAKSIPLNREIWVLTHSRHNEVYVQGFDPEKNALGPVQNLTLDQTIEILKKRSKPVLVGSGLRKNPNLLELGFTCLPNQFDYPHPQTLLEQAWQVELKAELPHPFYLRKSHAEENLKK